MPYFIFGIVQVKFLSRYVKSLFEYSLPVYLFIPIKSVALLAVVFRSLIAHNVCINILVCFYYIYTLKDFCHRDLIFLFRFSADKHSLILLSVKQPKRMMTLFS